MGRRAAIAVLIFAALYGGDYVMVRFRIPRSRNPLGSVTVQRYYSVMKKDGKPDYYFQPPQTETCVQSLFPHLGYSPCWYLDRHKVQKISV
jgi:hypothetical protein